MVIAAVICFLALVVAWIIAPEGHRTAELRVESADLAALPVELERLAS